MQQRLGQVSLLVVAKSSATRTIYFFGKDGGSFLQTFFDCGNIGLLSV